MPRHKTTPRDPTKCTLIAFARKKAFPTKVDSIFEYYIQHFTLELQL
jgi:hypothetical protein